MEEENYKKQAEEWQYQSMPMKSPEIVEIGEDSKSFTSSREGGFKDVYVAVGRDDLDVLKWALDHSVSPQARIFLVHVFPPQTYISTPVGRLSRSQLSKEQLKVYINEENNRRRNLLQKYIRLCTDAKVTVDTMLLESNTTTKAILDLIPVLNITSLVIGTKRPPCPRRSWKKLGTGEFIQKNAPEFCEVTIVFDGKKVLDGEQVGELVHSSPASSHRKPETTRNSERNFFECACFSGKFN